MYRTKTCGELNIKNVNEEVELSGWIQKVRNLGAMVFIDLRDEFGITQIVVNDEDVDTCIEAITKGAHTGKIGDGKIFVSDVERIIRIRTGEEDNEAI